MSPLRTACFDIFAPPPGAREVMTQVERLSSRDTKIALRSVRIAACSSGRGQRACMVAPEWVVQHPHSAREQGATNRAHGIFFTRVLVVVSKDENLTKGHARFLESRLIALTRAARRATLANGT